MKTTSLIIVLCVSFLTLPKDVELSSQSSLVGGADCNGASSAYDPDGLGHCTGPGGCGNIERGDKNIGPVTDTQYTYVDICSGVGCNPGGSWEVEIDTKTGLPVVCSIVYYVF